MEVADQEITEFDHRFGQEAREWLATVCVAMEKTPAGKLFSLLQPSITVPAGQLAEALHTCFLFATQLTPACRSSLSTRQKHLLRR